MLVEGNRTNREGDRGERMGERTGQRWTNNDPRVCFNNQFSVKTAVVSISSGDIDVTYLQGHEEKPGLSPDSQLYSSKFCLFQ